jgi:hypothetical protein
MATVAQPKKGLEQKAADPAKKNRKKKEKVKRVAWGDRNEKGQLKTKIKGKDITGWDPKVNLPLRKSDFENPADYLELTADRLEAKAKRFRELAKEEATLGSVADRKKAKKFKNIAEKFNALRDEFKASGMSDEQIAQFLSGGASAEKKA